MNRGASEAFFWMNGRLASQPEKFSDTPEDLNEDGFWAVQVDYEGHWTLVKFAQVEDATFLDTQWIPPKEPWSSTHDQAHYMNYVEHLRQEIARGEVYQVNACRILSTPYQESISGLFAQLLGKNPAPYASFLSTSRREIASASPELFLSFQSAPEGIRVKSSPIKGTSRERAFGEKDQSENIMIVDLMRNDLSRICRAGSVDVSRLLGIEEHPGLFHLVSDVTGILNEDFDWNDFVQALLPAGSISGAPKSSAVSLISEFEAFRGPYCGLLGWIEKRGSTIQGVLSVAIRIFWQENDKLHFGTGAGITWGSNPAQEWDETELKAKRLMSIANGGM
jgi:para-aminobenzoate synthetase component 1